MAHTGQEDFSLTNTYTFLIFYKLNFINFLCLCVTQKALK